MGYLAWEQTFFHILQMFQCKNSTFCGSNIFVHHFPKRTSHGLFLHPGSSCISKVSEFSSFMLCQTSSHDTSTHIRSNQVKPIKVKIRHGRLDHVMPCPPCNTCRQNLSLKDLSWPQIFNSKQKITLQIVEYVRFGIIFNHSIISGFKVKGLREFVVQLLD